MSKKTQKKTQKKTLKTPAKTPPREASRAASKKSTAKPAAKNKPAKAAKPAGSKRPAAKASHRGASKALKAQRPKAAAKPKANPEANPEAKRAADSKTGLSKTGLSKTGLSKTGLAKPTAPGSEATAANPSPPRAAPVAARAGLAEGTKAPAFRLPRDGGTTVSLSDFAGQKLVLFFYPRADTPGCTKEAIDFTRLSAAFAESKTAVLGVSADPPKAQEAFRNKHQLSVPLASDEQHAMLEAYGVWGEKSMYGRTFLGISRTTVLIGADSRVLRIWRNVKVDGHADEVLAEAQSA
jgi:thioredoxin-dependent peroxiredoxin